MKTTLSGLIMFLEELESKGDEVEMLRYEHGVLSTKGCAGDYGCCSRQIDVIGLIDDLKAVRRELDE